MLVAAGALTQYRYLPWSISCHVVQDLYLHEWEAEAERVKHECDERLRTAPNSTGYFPNSTDTYNFPDETEAVDIHDDAEILDFPNDAEIVDNDSHRQLHLEEVLNKPYFTREFSPYDWLTKADTHVSAGHFSLMP